MPFPWSEDTEVPKDAKMAEERGHSWGCVWIAVLPLLIPVLGKFLTQLV